MTRTGAAEEFCLAQAIEILSQESCCPWVATSQTVHSLLGRLHLVDAIRTIKTSDKPESFMQLIYRHVAYHKEHNHDEYLKVGAVKGVKNKCDEARRE